MRLLLALLVCSAVAAADLYFPPPAGDWQRADPAKSGWDTAAIDAVMEFAKSRKSTSVVILLNGKLLAEKRWDPPATNARYGAAKTRDGEIIEDVASAQKSITATLFGIAQRKGLIRLEDAVSKHLGEGWSKTPREQEARITMRHLLTMTSGLTDELAYESEPGARWRYNTPAYQKTIVAVAKAAGKSENEITREWLTGPLGMTHSMWRKRERGGGLLGFLSTARDLARFGLLIQNNGDWDGRAIVEDKAYLRDMLSPSQKLNPAYGYLWWLNRNRPFEAAPADLVSARGAMGRRVWVVPSLGIVATRTGDDPGERTFDGEFWRLLMKAAPAR